MIEGFQKMSKEEQDETYGGWAWLVAMVPLLLQSVVTSVASIKSIFSDKGSIKGKDVTATWDNKQGSTGKHEPVSVSYFAY